VGRSKRRQARSINQENSTKKIKYSYPQDDDDMLANEIILTRQKNFFLVDINI
jgi:hypothetical protein